MGPRQLGVLGLVGWLMLGGAGCSPDAESLRASFAEQLASVTLVSNFERDGDQLTFAGPDGGGGEAAWLVHIDSAIVEPSEPAESTPYRGIIQSSWYADGEPVRPVGNLSHLPSDFLDRGIAQDCWGLWDAADRRWAW